MSDKVAIITGAGSGIGRAVAQAMAAAGYRLALAGRRLDALEETAALCTGAPHAPLCISTDVTDEASVKALFEAVVARFGRVDFLFNNAGVNGGRFGIEAMSLDTWRQVVDTNLTGVFLCLREAFGVMRDQVPRGGRIINNGSISAHSPRPDTAAYCAAKHGVTGLTKSASLEGRKFDIAVGQIDIGNAVSAFSDQFTQGVPQADGRLVPEPVMDAARVGEAIVYMAGLPLDANIFHMTVMPTKMPFVGRG